MFSGHGNKSLHHCSVVQQGFGRTHRKVHSLLTGKCLGDVDRCKGSVESEREGLAVSCLAVRETRELLGIAKDELQLETCFVNVKDVFRRHTGICREEYLAHLALLICIFAVSYHDSDITVQADGIDNRREQSV